MEPSFQFETRWSDLDPNSHVKHSVYYDWGASARMRFLEELGLTLEVLEQHHTGAVLLKEECVFRREVRFGDKITLNFELAEAREDYSRWTVRHQILILPDKPAAQLTVHGAWIDTQKRKLILPPPLVTDIFSRIPRTTDFKWLDKA